MASADTGGFRLSDSRSEQFPAAEQATVLQKELLLDPALETTLTTAPRPASDPEKHESRSYIVLWNGPDDLNNPLNWSRSRKWCIVLLVALIAFVPPFASSIFAPATAMAMRDLHCSNDLLATLAVSVYMLGFAAGPLFFSPLSELYGRSLVLNVTNVLHLVFTVACAVSSNIDMLVVFRFLAGCVGSTPITVGGALINDIMPVEKRGKAMAFFVLGPTLGPSLGPVIGGFLAEAAGWRWVFWLLTILLGSVSLLTWFFLPETYPLTLINRKAEQLRKQTGDLRWQSGLTDNLSAKQHFWLAISRPMKLLILSPVVLGIAIFMAMVYGYLYLLFTTYPTVFEQQYHFSIGIVGLVYLGLGFGLVVASIVVGFTSDRQMIRMAARSGGSKPEYRLPLSTAGSPLIAVGLLWYGWSAEKKTHWHVYTAQSFIFVAWLTLPRIVPILGTVPIGAGIQCVFTPLSTYLLDAFGIYAASALAAVTVLRAVLAAMFPLVGPSLYAHLGLGWGNSLLGFLALAFSAVPLAFYRWGEYLRKTYEPRL